MSKKNNAPSMPENMNPKAIIIIGLDTPHTAGGPISETTHPLWDERTRDFDPGNEDSGRLIDSIQTFGVLNPISLVHMDGKFMALNGRQRTQAARFLQLPSVPVKVHHVDNEADLLGLGVTMNEIYKVDPLHVKGQKARRLMALGYNLEKLAFTFGVSKQAVGQWLKVDAAAPLVHEAIEVGVLSPTAALEIARLPREEQADAVSELTGIDAEQREKAAAAAADEASEAAAEAASEAKAAADEAAKAAAAADEAAKAAKAAADAKAAKDKAAEEAAEKKRAEADAKAATAKERAAAKAAKAAEKKAKADAKAAAAKAKADKAAKAAAAKGAKGTKGAAKAAAKGKTPLPTAGEAAAIVKLAEEKKLPKQISAGALDMLRVLASGELSHVHGLADALMVVRKK